jgi:polyhydroxybutyrate depolymerase
LIVVAVAGVVAVANNSGTSATGPLVHRAGPSPSAAPGDAPVTPGVRPAPIIYRPAALSRAKKVPLVVALHASGGTPALFETNSGWNAFADKYGFVVAYLGSAAPAWKDHSNVAYISSMIDRIKRSQAIDPSRVYVTGFSAGAYISYYVGCELSTKVAAIAPVSGAMHSQPCHLARPVSELTIMGTEDKLPLQGNARFPGVAAVTARWRRLDHCPQERARTVRIGPAVQETWGPCAQGSAVGLYIISGGHHVYPGEPGLGPQYQADARYRATAAVWAFFAAHTPTP